MTLRRAVPLLLVLAAVPPAAAQLGSMPGTPGAPAMPPFGAAPTTPPRACQDLLSLRDEVQKQGQALQAANQKKVGPEELCKLFRVYLRAESKMVKGVEEYQAACGVPAEAVKQVQAGHSKASQIAKQICEVAAAPGRVRSFDAPVPHCAEKSLRLGVPCVD
jgi:hypothetical protein